MAFSNSHTHTLHTLSPSFNWSSLISSSLFSSLLQIRERKKLPLSEPLSALHLRSPASQNCSWLPERTKARKEDENNTYSSHCKQRHEGEVFGALLTTPEGYKSLHGPVCNAESHTTTHTNMWSVTSSSHSQVKAPNMSNPSICLSLPLPLRGHCARSVKTLCVYWQTQ